MPLDGVVPAFFRDLYADTEFDEKVFDVAQVAVERALGNVRVTAKGEPAHGLIRDELVKEIQQNFCFVHFVLAGDSADPNGFIDDPIIAKNKKDGVYAIADTPSFL